MNTKIILELNIEDAEAILNWLNKSIEVGLASLNNKSIGSTEYNHLEMQIMRREQLASSIIHQKADLTLKPIEVLIQKAAANAKNLLGKK